MKYFLSNEPKKNALIFKHLTWASLLENWHAPIAGERPTAYIIILQDTEIWPTAGCDHGIVAQSMLLGAVEKGLGGCMLLNFNKVELGKALNIPAKYEIILLIALGKPKEKVVIETVKPDGDTKYWRDDKGVHHVPKRSLDEIIFG
jgi:nitroreductase